MPVSSIPNLSGPFGPEPGSATSKVLARKYTSPKRFVRAVPQISRYLEVGKGPTYAVILSLLTCSPAKAPVVSWSTKFTWPKNPPFLHPATRPKFAWLPPSVRVFSVITNPPPVVKSHGFGTWWASAGIVLSINSAAATSPPTTESAATRLLIFFPLLLIVFPPFAFRRFYAALLNTRSRRRHHHIGNSTDDDVKGIHYGHAGCRNRLLVDNNLTPGNSDR